MINSSRCFRQIFSRGGGLTRSSTFTAAATSSNGWHPHPHLSSIVALPSISTRPLSTSNILLKIRAKDKKDKDAVKLKDAVDIGQLKSTISRESLLKNAISNDDIDEEEEKAGGGKGKQRIWAGQSTDSIEVLAVKGATEMETCYSVLLENIANRMTLNVNLRVYEDERIRLENGETHKLYKLARITTPTPTTICLNFTDNPEAIKAARAALASKHPDMRQEGVLLHIDVPKITRERREELAHKMSASLLNEYKLSLNRVYNKWANAIRRGAKSEDVGKRMEMGLLREMHKMVAAGETRVKERERELLAEVL